MHNAGGGARLEREPAVTAVVWMSSPSFFESNTQGRRWAHCSDDVETELPRRRFFKHLTDRPEQICGKLPDQYWHESR